jgi:hypothetical protein
MTMMRGSRKRVSDDALDLVFRKAKYLQPMASQASARWASTAALRNTEMGATSANISPANFVFIRSRAAVPKG